MRSLRPLLRRFLAALFVLACAFAIPGAVSAGGSGLEDMLMPGQVIRAHNAA